MPDFLKNHEFAELSYYWAGVLLLIVTVGALLYARAQVAEAKKSSRTIAQQAQATLLLNLLDKWNSKEMREARSIFGDFKKAAENNIFQKYPDSNDKEVLRKLSEYYKMFFDKLYKQQKRYDESSSRYYTIKRIISYFTHEPVWNYFVVNRIMSFFETVGLLVNRKYILLTDVDALFRGPILDVGAALKAHIESRAEIDKGVPPGLYENALFLVSEIERICPK
jgi:hypothetical protein